MAAKALVAERAGLVTRISAALGEVAASEVAGHGSPHDEALSFSPTAWSSLPLGSLLEAGAADFVEPFEAQ